MRITSRDAQVNRCIQGGHIVFDLKNVWSNDHFYTKSISHLKCILSINNVYLKIRVMSKVFTFSFSCCFCYWRLMCIFKVPYFKFPHGFLTWDPYIFLQGSMTYSPPAGFSLEKWSFAKLYLEDVNNQYHDI